MNPATEQHYTPAQLAAMCPARPDRAAATNPRLAVLAVRARRSAAVVGFEHGYRIADGRKGRKG